MVSIPISFPLENKSFLIEIRSFSKNLYPSMIHNQIFFPDWIDILSIKMITSSICGERSFAQKLKDHQLYNGHQKKLSNFAIKHKFKQIVTASSIRRKKSEREREREGDKKNIDNLLTTALQLLPVVIWYGSELNQFFPSFPCCCWWVFNFNLVIILCQ